MTERYELSYCKEGSYLISSMFCWPDVTKPGYHFWCDRPWSTTAIRREELPEMIKDILRTSTIPTVSKDSNAPGREGRVGRRRLGEQLGHHSCREVLSLEALKLPA